MSRDPIVYPPLPEDLQQGITWRSIKYFGAGAIVASVTIASGESLFAARCGALFGYSFLWCFAAALLMKGVQVYSGCRYIVLTGEHPMTHWAYLPGPKNWVPITIAVLSLLCFPFWQAGLPLMLGNILNWVFHIPDSSPHLWFYARSWATLSILVSVALVLLESYAFLEKAQTVIVGLLLGSLLAAVFAAQPDWLAVIVGMVTPAVPRYEDWMIAADPAIVNRPPWVEIVTCVGAVGGGTYDYLGYVGLFREKGWGAIGLRHGKYEIDTRPPAMPLAIDVSDDNIRRGRRWLLPSQVDIVICFLSVFIFSLCFVILGAKILHPERLVPAGNNLFNYQANFLTRLHPALLYLYQLGIFCAFFGTIYGAYEVYFRTAFECLMPISPRFHRLTFGTFRRMIVLYCAVLGLVFLWTLEKPIDIVTPAALIGGVFTCGLWCLAMLWADRRFLPRPYQMPWLLWILVAVSGVVLTSLGAKGIWDYAAGWLTT
jgi:Mn2+/Fe2+ NRAMP family transporter